MEDLKRPQFHPSLLASPERGEKDVSPPDPPFVAHVLLEPLCALDAPCQLFRCFCTGSCHDVCAQLLFRK